jgi:hypothetical protein
MGKPRNDPLVLKDQDEESRCRWKMVRERHGKRRANCARLALAESRLLERHCLGVIALLRTRRSATPGSGANTDTDC